MRKYQQRQILNLLQTIKQAQSLNLYEDCRESAAGIGAFIDSIEGKGTQTAKMLAEYCELSSKARNKSIDEQQLRKYLAMIENSIRHELKPPDKIEVAFFPYNVSMFDSMESIYLAAKNDPQCDAYVVPIPYYNLLPDRSFGQLHYEGHLYPDNIPITHWQEYDVEARCPDIIFIHTPYDENNLVTSIHPYFYSERLRNFTGLLVYVPYFVGIDDVPEWICVHSGTVYADKIIVQSEKVKQTYIRVFKEFGKENNYEKHFGNMEDKIIALGSPKFDKILNARREDCSLPDNWHALIERSDGTRKKVIFYNTSLSSLLQGNDTYLKKLKSVLALFRECDDVVLWWRPHPLSKNTYKAMRPHLLDEYEQIVAAYQHECWGIYDDTPGLHRAIVWSDAYYGDMSSVIALYGMTGKPVMGNDISEHGYNREVYSLDENVVYFLNFACDSEGVGWAYSTFFNALCKLDLDNYTAKIVYRDRGSCIFYSYIFALPFGEYVLALPYYSDKLLLFNKNSGETKHISLMKEYVVKDEHGIGYKLGWALNCGEKILMFGHPNGLVIEYSLTTGEIFYNTIIADCIEKLSSKQNNTTPLGAVCFLRKISNTLIWFARKGCNIVLEYNFENSQCRKVVEFDKISDCENIAFVEDEFWIVPNGHGEVIRLNYKTQESIVYNDFPDKLVPIQNKNFFASIFNWGNDLLFLPAHGNISMLLNKSTGKMTEYAKLTTAYKGNGVVFKYDGAIQARGNKLLFFNRYDRAIDEYNRDTLEVSKRRFTLSDEDFKSYIGNSFDMEVYDGIKPSSTIIWDSWYSSNPIKSFVTLLNSGCAAKSQLGQILKNNVKNADGKCGEKIWQAMKPKN